MRYSSSTRTVVQFFDGKIKDNTYIEITKTMSPSDIGFSFSTLRPKSKTKYVLAKLQQMMLKLAKQLLAQQ